MRILVVEDESSVADVIEDALEAAGHVCTRADAAQAQAILSSGAVDGITLDLRIPGTDGLDWLSALHAQDPDLARRTVVVTGASLGPEDCRKLAHFGASVLAKPFHTDELVATLARQLSPLHRVPLSRD
jgi:DNA-binding response OmpR family regulator